MAFPELPDNLMPRRGLDMSPADYADIGASRVGLMSEQEIADEIDRLDIRLYGARVDDLMMVEEDGVSRLKARIPDDDAELPTFLALSTQRMLLRSRQLALRHDPEHADERVRLVARQWVDVFAEHERQLHEGEP